MRKGNQLYGDGNLYETPFRNYDPRLGRWLSPDPIQHPWQGSYTAFNNNPIYFVNPLGLEGDENDGGCNSCSCNPDCKVVQDYKQTVTRDGETYVIGAKATMTVESKGNSSDQSGDGNGIMAQNKMALNNAAEEINKAVFTPEKLRSQRPEISQAPSENSETNTNAPNPDAVDAAKITAGTSFGLLQYDQNYNYLWKGSSKYGSILKSSAKWGSRALFAYDAARLTMQAKSNKIYTSEYFIQLAATVYPSFGGIYGVAFGIGWQAGKYYGPRCWDGDCSTSWIEDLLSHSKQKGPSLIKD